MQELGHCSLVNVFKHNLDILVLKFDSLDNLINATQSDSFWMDIVNPPFEFFLNQWDEKLFLYSYEIIEIWVQFSDVPFTFWIQ